MNFDYIVFFQTKSANKFSYLSRKSSLSKKPPRKVIEEALRKDVGVRKICSEFISSNDLYIISTSESKPYREYDRYIAPLAAIEAMGINSLNDDEKEKLEERGALIFKNTTVRRHNEIRRYGIRENRFNKDNCWHLDNFMNGYKRENSGDGIRVGIVDTGIDTAHPEFKNKRIAFAKARGHRIERTPLPVTDKEDHGTAVASIIVGKNTGICPDAEIAVCDAFESDEASRLDVLTAINWLVDNPFKDGRKVDLINLSIGTDGNDDYFREAISAAVQFDGIIFSAAIGNEFDKGEKIQAPACYPEVVSVGAHDEHYAPAPFSCRGRLSDADVEQPDVWAPGTKIYAAADGGIYDQFDGTSFASPLVAGALLRLLYTDPKLRKKPMLAMREFYSRTEHAASDIDSENFQVVKCVV